MTHEEAIEIMSNKICYNLLGCMDGECKHSNESPCAIQIAIDALQEKADEEKKIKKAVERAKEWGGAE